MPRRSIAWLLCWLLCGLLPGLAGAAMAGNSAANLTPHGGIHVSQYATAGLTLGIFAHQPKQVLKGRYQPLADYLGRQLGITVTPLLLSQDEMAHAIAAQRVDMLMTNPTHYIWLRAHHPLSSVLATRMSVRDGMAVASLGGVVIARRDRPAVQQLDDLRGKQIAIPGKTFLGAYQIHAQELKERGIDIAAAAKLEALGSMDAVVNAVLDGRVDAGFIRSGLLEEMLDEGIPRLDQLRVVSPYIQAGFPFAASTRLYPEWPFIALPWLDTDLARRLALSLLQLDAEHPVSRQIGIGGFAPAADYLPVEQLTRSLKLPPYDSAPPLTLASLWQNHRDGLLVGLLLIVTVLVMLQLLARRNQALQRSLAELSLSENRHRTYIERAPEAIFIADAQGCYTHANPAAEALLGYTRAELHGLPVATHWPARFATDYQAALQQVFAEGQLDTELKLVAKNGSERLVALRAIRLPDGQVIGFCRDITGQRAIEARRQLLEYAIDQVDEAVYLVDAKARFHYVNEGAARLLGYRPAELLDKRVFDIDPYFTPEHWQAHWDSLLAQQSVVLETSQRHRAGHLIDVEVCASLIEFAGTRYNVALVRDVSQRKQIEAQQRAARQQAEELAEAKSRFLANMSHEIRTPINAVLGFARIGLRDSPPGALQDNFDHIHQAGQHLLAVINDILDFSKIEAGKLQIQPQPFRLAGMLAQLRLLMSEAAAGKPVHFAVIETSPLPNWVHGDAQRVLQILSNLLSNAFKFTSAGSVQLRLACDNGHCRFAVSDTGIGMSAQEIERLFQPFVQADATLTRNYGGTGLGLVISRNLAQAMGGELTVTSQPGSGSTFTLQLPLPPCAAPAGATQDADPLRLVGPQPLAGLHLLAVEDERFNRMIIEDLLLKAGARVSLAENGLVAVDRVHAAPTAFDAVLMDVQMPVMDGHTATRRLHEIAPALPVIGLTAHALAEERERCLAAGMVMHLAKPIEPAGLIQAVLGTVHRVPPGLAPIGSAVPATAVPPAPTFPAEDQDPPAGSTEIDWPVFTAPFREQPEVILTLIGSLIEDHGDSPYRLRQLLAQGDHEDLRGLAHRLKGLAGYLAAAPLQAQAAVTEKAARSGDAALAEATEQLASRLERLLAECRDRMPTP